MLRSAKAQESEGKDLVQDQVQSIELVEGQLGQEERAQDQANEAALRPANQPAVKAPQQLEYKEISPGQVRETMAVVQLTLMPKSSRFYWSGSGTFLLNDVLYKTIGADGRLGYFFNETWGLEFQGLWMTSLKGEELKDLEDKHRVTGENSVWLKNFYGASVVFNSIYGKMALWNRKIYPFEIYQTLGYGKVGTGSAGQSDAIKLGIGQVFAFDKNSALRLDLTILSFQAKNTLGNTQAVNSLLFTVGFEKFFNKASVR